MRHRIFILLLAGALVLAMALLRNAAQATPYAGGALFGDTLPLWELRAAIPFGIFTAGLFVVWAGLGAQLLRGILLLTGRGNTPTATHAGTAATAALWCGWPFVLCCTGALLYIAPEYYIPQAGITPNHLSTLRPLLTYQLYGSVGIMLLCHLLTTLFPLRRWVGAVLLLLLWLPILSTDILWAGGHGRLLLILALCFTAMVLTGSRLNLRHAFGLLLLAVSAIGFVYILQPRSSGGVFPVGAADYVFFAAALVVILLLAWLKATDIRCRRRH